MSSQSGPLISVVTATRNRTELLGRALRSIHAQSFGNYEAIVIDDGSDESVRQWQDELRHSLDERFRFVRPVPPGGIGSGPSRARNRGIGEARGKYVAFLDDDDEWLTADHLAVAAEICEREQVDYYFGNMYGYRDDKVTQPHWFPLAKKLTAGRKLRGSPDVFDVPLANFADVLKHHVVHASITVVLRELLASVHGFVEGLTGHEDVNLMMRLADRAKKIAYRPDCVARYRFPTGNAHSLEVSDLMKILHKIGLAAHVRATCKSRLVLNCARSWEAWSQRELAELLERQGSLSEALRYRWQALCTFPTLGTVREVLTTIGKRIRRLR